MKVENLNQAIAEAKRFLEVAGAVKIDEIVGTHKAAGIVWDTVRENCKESAACKRVSMDLTRVLSKLRNE